jgi:hydroxylamine reductase
MFCFQCEQTVGGKACTKVGACGKSAVASARQDELTAALIDLALAAEDKKVEPAVDALMMRGLFATVTNVNFDDDKLAELTATVKTETGRLGGGDVFDPAGLFAGDQDVVSLPMPGMPISWVKPMNRLMPGSTKVCGRWPASIRWKNGWAS